MSTAMPLLPLWVVQPVQSLSACTVQLYLYSPYGSYSLYRASAPVQYSYTSTPPMGRTASTEPQCLYSTAIPLVPLWAVRNLQSLSACTVQLYLYSPYGSYSLYRASVPVQGCTLPLSFIPSLRKNARIETHARNTQYPLRFHGKDGYAIATQYCVVVHCMPCCNKVCFMRWFWYRGALWGGLDSHFGFLFVFRLRNTSYSVGEDRTGFHREIDGMIFIHLVTLLYSDNSINPSLTYFWGLPDWLDSELTRGARSSVETSLN